MDGPAKPCRSVRLDNGNSTIRREYALAFIVPKKLFAYGPKRSGCWLANKLYSQEVITLYGRENYSQEAITIYGSEEQLLIGRVEVQH